MDLFPSWRNFMQLFMILHLRISVTLSSSPGITLLHIKIFHKFQINSLHQLQWFQGSIDLNPIDEKRHGNPHLPSSWILHKSTTGCQSLPTLTRKGTTFAGWLPLIFPKTWDLQTQCVLRTYTRYIRYWIWSVVIWQQFFSHLTHPHPTSMPFAPGCLCWSGLCSLIAIAHFSTLAASQGNPWNLPERSWLCKHCFNGASDIWDPIADFKLTISHWNPRPYHVAHSEQTFLVRILACMTRSCWTFWSLSQEPKQDLFLPPKQTLFFLSWQHLCYKKHHQLLSS